MAIHDYVKTCRYAFILLILNQGANAALPSFVETQTIRVDNPHPFEDLGYSLAVSDDLLLAGAINSNNSIGDDVGSVFVYRRSAVGVWHQVAQIFASDAQHNAAFGQAVAFEGDNAIVGSFYRNYETDERGAAYLFQAQSDTNWQELVKFVPPPGSEYKTSVALDGRAASVTGSRRIDRYSDRGFVDIFRYSDANSWTLAQQISIPGFTSTVRDVAMDDGFLVVGASGRLNPTSSVEYRVELYQDTGTLFTHIATLRPSIGAESVAFGAPLAIDGDRIIVGAYLEASPRGAAYIFERSDSGIWEEKAHLTPQNAEQRTIFGRGVALNGNMALIASDGLGGMNKLVHVFLRNEVGEWHQVDDLMSDYAGAAFGFSVAASNGQAIVSSGLNAPGAIHVFTLVPEPSALAQLTPLALAFVLSTRRAASIPRRRVVSPPRVTYTRYHGWC